ncbi:MAG: type II secretion system major pseudopilin GspG [Deltaproteobacteria bacterium]|nr:type II secretion system major pseudopilin GspG [Deltaproteobacteria bacterium]
MSAIENTPQPGAPARRRRPARGMTLIEIMVVITLLGLIAAAVGVAAMNMLEQGQLDSSRTQAMELAKAMDSYKVLFGRYPSNSEGLQALVSPPGGGKPIIERVPKDPWGGDYIYTIPGVKNPGKFDIRSNGPDRTEGGGDDVGNWPAEGK